ncbi:hypothetical protein ABTM68_20280, partial [Acinetobacter baumannii]
KKIEQLELKQLNSIKESLLAHKISFDLSNTEKAFFIGAVVELGHADLVKKLSFELKPGLGNNYIVALAANIEGKATVSVMLSDSIV